MTVTDRAAGREGELRQLNLLLDEACTGRGRAALVVGEAGIGKTTLAEIVAETARTRGICVGFGRCSASEMPAAWPWRQAAGTIDRSLGDVLNIEHDTTRPAVLAAATERLCTALSGSPALIVIEDVHWADRTTLALTTFVASAIRDMPLALLITARDEPLAAAADGLLDLGALATSVLRMELGGIDVDAVRVVISAIAGSSVDATLASQIHERTGGNPFFVEEVARLWTMRGPAAHLEVPAGVADVLRRRLARLPQQASTTLGAASLLGEPDPELLPSMTGDGEDQVLTSLGEAMAIGVVRMLDGRFAFAHDLVRDTLAASLAPVTRARWHRAAAETLELLRPAEHARIAVHWRNARGPDAQRRAAAHAHLAAADAMQSLGYEQAVRYYGWALEAGSEESLDDEVGLGEAQLLAGDLRDARETLRTAAQRALEHGDGELLARAVLAMGTGVGGFEVDIYDDEQRTLLEKALRLLPEGDSSLRAAVGARFSLSRSLVAPIDERAAGATAAAEMAARVG
ncbi:MAG TPA: AAA family ATPase, partial [Candidatus Dormibacteraeota bacterium]